MLNTTEVGPRPITAAEDTNSANVETSVPTPPPKKGLDIPNPEELKAAALNALELGFHPIPFRFVDGTKKPIVKWKRYKTEAPTPAEIEAWPWHQADGVGILTGVGDGHPGVDVIDFDPRHDPWPPEGCELPTDCIVNSRRPGARHVYVLHVPGATNSASKIGNKIDTRALGGFVAIPPTPGYSYATGSLAEAAKADPPQPWLAEALSYPGGRPAGTPHSTTTTKPAREPSRRACKTILRSYIRTAAAGPDSHKRNDVFFRAACAVAPHIIKGEFNRDDVWADFEALLRENKYIEDDGIDAAKATFQSALDTAAAGEPLIKPYKPKLWTPDDLEDADFPPPEWLLEPLLPESKVIALLGAPKVGKSWLALLWASKIYRSIYVPLEGNTPERIKERKTKLGITGDNPIILFDPPPPRMPEGLDAIAGIIAEMNPRPRAIFLDPWANFKPRIKGNSRAYETDYEHGDAIRSFAVANDVSVIIIHHTRKRINTSTEQNPFEEALGTTGFLGSTDTSLILRRHFTEPRGQLLLTSRDVEEYKKDMEFDGALWTLLGEAYYDYADSKERLEVQDVLRDFNRPLRAKEIADELGKNPTAIRKLLTKMYQAGEVERPDRGLYTVPTGNNGNKVTNAEKPNACMDF